MTTHVEMRQRVDNKLCFDLDERNRWTKRGKNAQGMTCFDIDVVFHKNKRQMGFYIHAPTIQVALEIVEAYGQQFKSMDAAEFSNFRNAHAGKTIFFHSINQQKNGADKIVFFKPDRHQKTLELAFGSPPSTTRRELDIDRDILNHIDVRVQEEEDLKVKKKKKLRSTANNNRSSEPLLRIDN
jgi:hypothetical protein